MFEFEDDYLGHRYSDLEKPKAIVYTFPNELFVPVNKIEYKFNEPQLLEEYKKYVDSTYTKHYTGQNGVQAIDLTFAAGHLEGAAIHNIMKYSFRYGKKNGYNREDILKLIHYGFLLLHNHDTYRTIKDKE